MYTGNNAFKAKYLVLWSCLNLHMYILFHLKALYERYNRLYE